MTTDKNINKNWLINKIYSESHLVPFISNDLLDIFYQKISRPWERRKNCRSLPQIVAIGFAAVHHRH